MNLQFGRQGEEPIWNTLAGSISCRPVPLRSPIPFVIKGINGLPPLTALAKEGNKTSFPLLLLSTMKLPRMQILEGLLEQEVIPKTVSSHYFVFSPCTTEAGQGQGPWAFTVKLGEENLVSFSVGYFFGLDLQT